MAQIAIPSDVSKRAANFTGRRWVLDAVAGWLGREDERFMLLTGEPGSGKTALAAWLAGAGPTPDDAAAGDRLRQVRDAWHAAHFCMAEDKRGTLNPARFAQSLAHQLSDQYDTYAEAVLHRIAPEINIHQEPRENWGQMIGAQIDTFIVNANAEDVYNRVVREPLETLCDADSTLRLFILVDALDEALTFGHPNIVTLLAGSGDLPAGVRFLLTSRDDPKVLDQFKQKEILNLSSPEHAGDADADVLAYVAERLTEDAIQAHVSQVGSAEVVRDTLVERAAGNFLYVQFLLDEVAQNNRSLEDLESLPRGLYGLYRTFLDRLLPDMLQVGASQRWLNDYQPLLGCLSVATPAAPLPMLPEWLDRPEGDVGALLNDLIQIIEYEPSGKGGYRLYHRSMTEFLAAGTYRENGAVRQNRYHTPPAGQHQRIVDYYLDNFTGYWSDCDFYGLRELVSHIQARRALERKPRERRNQAQALYDVVLDEEFRRAQRREFGDTTTTLADLRAALDVALEQDDLVKALACLGAYRSTLQGESVAETVFAAVDAGNLELAFKRAQLYRAVPDWARVLQLYLAWEAARVGDVGTVREAVTTAGRLPLGQGYQLGEALLVHLAQVLARTAGDAKSPQAWLTELWPAEDMGWLLPQYAVATPPAPAERDRLLNDLNAKMYELEQLVAEGDAEAVSMVPFIDEETMAYRAANLRDLLVQLAAEPAGQAATDRVLQPVVTNPYPRYRDIALVALGVASLAVPDADWVAEHLRHIIRTGLDRQGVHFTFDLPAVLLAETERRGRPAPDLADYVNAAVASDDRWGTSMRARSARAAALFHQGQFADALTELRAAADEPSGFAGYATVTLLSLANRWLEFGRPTDAGAQIANLVNTAGFWAGNVRAPDFREARVALVATFRDWLVQPAPDEDQARAFLASTSDRDERLAYVDHVSALWASAPAPGGLETLVLQVLGDGTTLDAVLGRLVGTRVRELNDADLDEAVRVCGTSLATSRPWELGLWR